MGSSAAALRPTIIVVSTPQVAPPYRVALRGWLPSGDWARNYDRRTFLRDLGAGVTTGAVLIPQAMGLAMLAGLPPIVGLHAAFLPLLAYAAFGTSRHLAIGPVATDSLLVASALAGVASAQYGDAAAAFALCVGVSSCALAALRLGFIAQFLSRPVISGFTSAAALLMSVNQLGYLLGVELPHTQRAGVILLAAARSVERWHVPTVAISVASCVLLTLLQRRTPHWPRGIVLVIAAIGAAWGLGLEGHGVRMVGEVPPGLPQLRLPTFDGLPVGSLFSSGLALACVFFVEAMSVSKHFARVHRYELRANQELLALGAVNFAAGVTGAYPIGGSFSRSAVNSAAGARTPLCGAVTALFIAVTLLLLTDLFRFLPEAVLAAVIAQTLPALLDVAYARRLYESARTEFVLLVLTFATTLVFGIQAGLYGGMLASTCVFLLRTTQPEFPVLGRIPGTDAYLSVQRHPHARQEPGVLVVRVDTQLYFANVGALRDRVRQLVAERSCSAPPMSRPPASSALRAVVLDASGLNQLDAASEEALSELDQELADQRIALYVAHLPGPARAALHRSGLLQRLAAAGRVALHTHNAVSHALGHGSTSLPPSEDDPRAPEDRVGCGPPPRT